jgi:hypothetical protein
LAAEAGLSVDPARAPAERSGARAWVTLGEHVFSPAAAAWGERGLTLICRSSRGELLVRERRGISWSPPRSLGVPFARDESGESIPVDWPIAACSSGDGRIHLLARGPEGELVHGVLRNDDWSGFSCIGVPTLAAGHAQVPMGLSAPPSASSREPGTLDVYAVGAAGDLLHSSWDESGFGEFVSLGHPASEMPFASPVSACSCGPRRVALFARGLAGDLLLKWWDGDNWSPFRSLGAPEEDDVFYPGNPRPSPLSGAPVACAGGTRRIDVFARGAGGDLLHRWWNGHAWSGYVSLQMPLAADGSPIPFTGSAVACAWGRYQLDVVALAADGKLYNLSWPGSGAPGLGDYRHSP